jgi:hypothetical protein
VGLNGRFVSVGVSLRCRLRGGPRRGSCRLREALTFFEKQPNTKGLNYNLYAQIARDLLAGIPDPE